MSSDELIVEQWRAAVATEIGRGLAPHEAVRAAQRKNPALARDYERVYTEQRLQTARR